MLNQAITKLYKQLSSPILKFILKRNGGDLEVAEQVVQDTFIAALTSFHAFHNKSTYFTWLCKIALNKLSDYYRDQVHRKSKLVIPVAYQLDQLMSPELAPEEKLAIQDLKLALSRCLNLLPPEYRRLLQLKYYEELSSREISLQLHLAPRELEGRLYRARKSLATVVSRLYPHLKDE
jgi:RNA polymerase sigma-70 factor (ECF subfamily)